MLTSSSSLNPLNTTAPPPWVPTSFSITAIISDDKCAPMVITGVYMNAVHAMYDLCYKDKAPDYSPILVPSRLRPDAGCVGCRSSLGGLGPLHDCCYRRRCRPLTTYIAIVVWGPTSGACWYKASGSRSTTLRKLAKGTTPSQLLCSI